MDIATDYSEVPYLNDILGHLPIDAIDKEDISTYIQNILSVIAINYKYEQYQFAYFGLHLLYMTYIYCTVWKISKINSSRYGDAVVFAKPYNNKAIDLCCMESIFEYSLVSEKELPKIFKIIELDKAQIGSIIGLVDIRNDMAHASGKFDILTDSDFNTKANSIFNSINNIYRCMDKQIRMWFRDVLLQYCEGKFDGYSDIKDIISEQMIQNFYLSSNDLLICNKMSIRNLVSSSPDFKKKLSLFKRELKFFCENSGYI